MNSELKDDVVEIEYKKSEQPIKNEDPAVSEETPIEVKITALDVEIEASKRPGPKSSAQTPSKPSERRRGSDKNPSGSAGRDSDKAIDFSAKVIEALKNKVKEHNSKQSKKVSLSQLKKVYRRGAGAFSSSHRPGKTRGQWAMARVNMFLRMMSGKSVKDSYRKADIDISKSSEIHFLYEYDPCEEDFIQASIDEKNFGLDSFEFDNVDDLYIYEDEEESGFWFNL